ncbi:Uu.00g010670.m01.CDS01 [Anthostomella pinea]|uniref:Uu.00g010670.m01.CDS01 n=1 Tax=Anthostomella pinea TaxID=933095 RepID=A0AAI8YQ10_9PEZI|nr:Uu.00g010670.m01.CDS01 [Anthostomella pinea]
MHSLLASAALSALTYSALAAVAADNTVQHCPIDGVCYRVGVPAASAASDSGNIYLQLQAPTSYAWVALGQGTQMSGSNIFVLYTDGTGNVTVSPRTGTGHVPPESNAETKLELLAGSGVSADGATMLANVRCANCRTWPGGSMSLSDSQASWIGAWKSGASLDSSDVDVQISRHDAHDSWTFDLTQAAVANDVNPFVAAATGGSGSGSGNSGGSSSDPDADVDTSAGPGSGASPAAAAPWYVRQIPTITSAHGILMALVMVILYPLGAVLMPLFGVSWVLHAAWQMVAFLAMWAGFALGVVLAHRTGLDFNSSHQRFGTAIVALFAIQPIGGYLHHLYYMKHQRRGLVSHAHIWYGRVLMLMGIINGGLGLRLADESNRLVIAYSIVAAVVSVIYIGGALFGVMKRRRAAGAAARGDEARKGS